MIVLGAVLGALVTMSLCPPVIRALGRRAILDVPGERSSHSQPTLRGGGLAPALGAGVGAALASASSSGWLLIVPAIAFSFGALGLADDVASLPARWRLLMQIVLATAAAVAVAPKMTSGLVMIAAVVLAALWLVAFVNAFNFMDGINGISAAQTAVAGVAWSAVGAWQHEPILTAGGLVVAGAALGFLPFNFPTARVFLGDVGSYFFGAWLAVMVLVALERGITPEMAVAPVLLYLCDTGLTLLRRLSRRAAWMEPHREHTYQRLLDGGWTHARTTVTVATIIGVSALLGAGTLLDSVAIRAAADVALALLMVGYLMLPRWQNKQRSPVTLTPTAGGLP